MGNYSVEEYIDDYDKADVTFADIYPEIERVSAEVIDRLRESEFTISAAESCTGGLFIASLIGISGSSDVINESYVTYANEAKIKLVSVPESEIIEHGAVSEEVASYMAKGVCDAALSNVGVGITGIAGPTGGTDSKPVGLVYIGICVEGSIHVVKCNFKGDRISVRLKSVLKALLEVKKLISK